MSLTAFVEPAGIDLVNNIYSVTSNCGYHHSNDRIWNVPGQALSDFLSNVRNGPSGRDEIKSLAYKIARSKTTLDNIGKEHVAEIKAKAKAIDNLRAEMRDDLDALKHEIRAPLDEWEAEQERIIAEQNRRDP